MIAIDIDSTLYDFRTPFRQAFLDLALAKGEKTEYFRGAYQPWVEWRSMVDICGDDRFAEALAVVHSPEVIVRQNPFDDAPDVIRELADQHEIFYISNRHEDTRDPTDEWLEDWGFPEAPLICTMENKMSFIRGCDTIIDDRPKTLCDFVYGTEQHAFGLLFEYNRALTDVPGIWLAPTWAGLRYYLQREGVLSA